MTSCRPLYDLCDSTHVHIGLLRDWVENNKAPGKSVAVRRASAACQCAPTRRIRSTQADRKGPQLLTSARPSEYSTAPIPGDRAVHRSEIPGFESSCHHLPQAPCRDAASPRRCERTSHEGPGKFDLNAIRTTARRGRYGDRRILQPYSYSFTVRTNCTGPRSPEGRSGESAR